MKRIVTALFAVLREVDTLETRWLELSERSGTD